MSQNEISRRVALQTLLLGAAGAAVAGCGGKESAPAASATPPPAAEPAPAAAPAAEAPAAAPAAAPAESAAATGPLPALDPKDPQAVALGYVTDASTLDPAKHPPFQPGRLCGNCVQFKGAAGDAQGPCGIFAGKSVVAAGWCKVWAPKPA